MGLGVGINLWNCHRENTPPFCSLNWLGPIWAAGKDSPARCSPHRDTTRCCLAGVGPSGEHPQLCRALMRSWKTLPFTRNYSSPLERFHPLLERPRGLSTLPRHPPEPVRVGSDLHPFPQLSRVLWSLSWALVAVLSSQGNYNSSLWFSRHLH